MALPHPRKAVISQGWLRAILLFIVYMCLSVAAGFFVPTLESWIVVSFVIAIVSVYVFRKFIDRKSFESLGLRVDQLFPHAWTGLLLGILLVSCGTLIIYLLNGIEWVDMALRMNDILMNVLLLLMVAAGEELVFRGYVLRNLAKSINKWLALLASSALFTLVHASNPSVAPIPLLNTFLGGLVMGITFLHTRNLWLPVLFHFTWNFLQGPVVGFPVSGLAFESILIASPEGDPTISGASYGFEGSLVCSTLLLLTFIGYAFAEHKRPYAGDVYLAANQ